MLGLYIHIPFCQTICSYCDFPKRIANSREMIKEYLQSLKVEMESYRKHFFEVCSVYIGGGTPNSLSDEELDLLLSYISIEGLHLKEFTIEINPELLTENQIKILKKHQINRISIGVQSFQPELLKILKRNHDKQLVLKAVKSLKEAGFDNISIDMIHSIPTQKISDLKADLNEVINLDVQHISYYGLSIEDKTMLKLEIEKNKYKIIDEDLSVEFFQTTKENLQNNNFTHYEISNFAKDNYQSFHNTLYWRNQKYIGIGVGAAGYLDNVRYNNNNYFKDYRISPIMSEEILTIKDQLTYEIILGLRLLTGLNIVAINLKYNIDFFRDYPIVNELIKQKLLIFQDGFLFLSEEGILISNQVFEKFV
ncbi:MAG: radical SAM family heme chaperone HemW [Erysipelotrichales bacterium]|nr:radical SAM family heme chaperone HemW [Erysipelotrichales bacterium]